MNLTSGSDLFVNLSDSDTVNVLLRFPEPLSAIRACSRLYSDAELEKVNICAFLIKIAKLYSEGVIMNSRLDSRSQHTRKSSESGAVELTQMLWLGVVLILSLSVTVYCWPLRERVK